jgi:putative transposase
MRGNSVSQSFASKKSSGGVRTTKTDRSTRHQLSDRVAANTFIFAANRTLEIAAALNLEPCFTLVESPESNDMAEAFVKTFKRDYIRINPLPDARTALSRIDHWMEDYNSEHPHSRLGYRSSREYIASLQQAACPV